MEKSRRGKHDNFLSVLQFIFGLNICIIIVLLVLVGIRNSTENTQKFTKQQKFKGKSNPILFLIKLMKSIGNVLPVPHVALVYQDGSVYDLSLHEDLSPSQGKLLKLPKDVKNK